MKRENGFYWVRILHTWVIAEWDSRDWFMTGSDDSFQDSDFTEIIEVRLTQESR